MHFTCKKRDPPPAEADCVSASGKTRPFAPTVRADLYRTTVCPGAMPFFTKEVFADESHFKSHLIGALDPENVEFEFLG